MSYDLLQVFQCSGDDMNLVLTGGVTPATSPKVLSPGTLLSPPPAPAPRLLAQHIAHQSLLARQHENLLLASMRPPPFSVLPTYQLRAPSPAVQTPQYQLQQFLPQPVVPMTTKRTYERAFTQTEAAVPPAKRQYLPQQFTPSMSLPMFSYGTSSPVFSYANTASPMLSYANALQAGIPTALPTGYGTALSAALPPTMSTPFPATFSVLPYPYYPGV